MGHGVVSALGRELLNHGRQSLKAFYRTRWPLLCVRYLFIAAGFDCCSENEIVSWPEVFMGGVCFRVCEKFAGFDPMVVE